MKHHIVTGTVLSAALLSLGLFTGSAIAANTETRVTETFNIPDLNASKTIVQTKKKPVELSELSSKTGEQLRSTSSVDYWFYDAWVTLYGDQDYDGYYTNFDLEFDADTNYYRAPVYAVVYIGINDVYEPYHVTSIFELYSDSSEDSVLLESELITGYPPKDYDILIELIDAETDMHVASIDAYSDADLSYQSMESLDFDQPVVTEVVVETHAGSWGILTSLSMAALVFFRRFRK